MRDICFVLTFVTSSSSYDASLLFFSILFYIFHFFYLLGCSRSIRM